MKSILQKDLDRNFVDAHLAENLIDADYTNFDVEDSQRLNVTMRSDYVCVALIHYESGEVRAFNIDLTEDRDSAPLLYLVQDINETANWERS